MTEEINRYLCPVSIKAKVVQTGTAKSELAAALVFLCLCWKAGAGATSKFNPCT